MCMFLVRILFVWILLPLSANAATSNEMSLYEASVRLNLRYSPSLESGVALTIEPGTVVNALSSDSGGWRKVRYNEDTLYASSRYLVYKSQSHKEVKHEKTFMQHAWSWIWS